MQNYEHFTNEAKQIYIIFVLVSYQYNRDAVVDFEETDKL